MYSLARPVLFSFPPNVAHRLGMAVLGPLEASALARALVRRWARVRDERLEVRAMGLTFPSPLGIAGGFDKNGTRARALAALGFGFVEVGTVTAQAQAENPPPNLFRLPRDRALVNRLGFPNEGARAVVSRLASHGGAAALGVPLGVSIGKSRVVPLDPVDGVVADYLASFQEAAKVADFVVVNVSSPNTQGLRAMQGAALARALLTDLSAAARTSTRRPPLLVKIAPDLADAEIDEVVQVAREVGLAGVVATNTTIARTGLTTDAKVVEAVGAGGLSGPPLRARALDVVKRVRKGLGKGPVLIGVGGIEKAEHAWAMLEAGADLLQLYTGFVYEGPFVATSIGLGIGDQLGALAIRSVGEVSRQWRS